MTTWSKTAVHTGIAVGAAGLLAGLWHALQDPDRGLGWIGIGVTPLYVVAVWLVLKRPEHPQTRRLLLLGSAVAVNTGIEGPIQDTYRAHGAGQWLWWANLVSQYAGLLSMIAAVLLIASFPDGTVERRWQAVVLRLTWLHLLLPPLLLLVSPTLVTDRYLFETPLNVPSPFAVSWLAWLAGPLETLAAGFYGGIAVIPVLFVRFFQAGPEQRARMRPLVWVSAAILVVYPLQGALSVRAGEDNPAVRLLDAVTVVMGLAIPAAIVIGIVRHRLFDIELVVRRSVVFGVLSIGIAVVYLGLAAAPGLALGDQIPVELAVGVTIAAAVAFQPLRRGLERLADRVVFGERVNRYDLLTTFGARLEHTVELGELLPRLADTVQRGLDARWVRVSVPGANAVAGTPEGEPALSVPLGPGGRIDCGAKEGGYEPGDHELLDTLAGQAATAIANVRLSAELAEQVAELARSRARIVAAQNAERQRIERNIHDGAQQHVVALIMKLRLARNQLGRGERSADDVLDELQSDARDLLTDLRELAHGIHPPVLSDQGLVAAVEARADRLPFDVRVHADAALRAGRMDADVEGAAYFVICEALTNIVKHAGAHTAAVELSTVDGRLTVLVRDDGIGLGGVGSNGHGLTNLRDRVEALGGSLRVDGETGAGTSVRAELPVGAAHG